MQWHRSVSLLGLVLVILIGPPSAGLAAEKLVVVPNDAVVLARINQSGRMTIASIRHDVLYGKNLPQAITDVRLARARAYRVITEAVNDYQAIYHNNLQPGHAQEADAASKQAINFSIFEVQVTAQKTLKEVDEHIKKMSALPSPSASPSTSPIMTNPNWLRTTLPSQAVKTIYGDKPQLAPTAARSYARSGGTPFLPIQPYNSRVAYQMPGAAVPRPNFMQSIGVALGGYLGAQNFFAPQPKLRISEAFYDPKQYTATLYNEKGEATTISVPAHDQPSVTQNVKPGRYEVFYKTIGDTTPVTTAPAPNPFQTAAPGLKPTTTVSAANDAISRIGLGAKFTIVIQPGETWCFQVPMPPARCI